MTGQRRPDSPAGSREGRWLFKPAVIPQNGHRQDEDRTEAVVADLAALLGVPHAEVELARRDEVEGSISRNVAPDGWNLVLGSVLMTSVVPDYQEGRRRVAGRPGHSVANLVTALTGCGPPPGFDSSAVDYLASYLLLDAWVANQDRHDQNWAVLRRADDTGALVLAPSYDHASSLGFSLGDEQRHRLVAERRVEAWARKGRGHRFEHDATRPPRSIPTLVEVARVVLDLAGAVVRDRWLGRLADLRSVEVAEAVHRTTELSDPSATFILTLLDVDRRRILDEC